VAYPGGDVHEQAADEMRKRVEQALGASLNVALGRFTLPACGSSGNGMPSWGTAELVIYDDADQLG